MMKVGWQNCANPIQLLKKANSYNWLDKQQMFWIADASYNIVYPKLSPEMKRCVDTLDWNLVERTEKDVVRMTCGAIGFAQHTAFSPLTDLAICDAIRDILGVPSEAVGGQMPSYYTDDIKDLVLSAYEQQPLDNAKLSVLSDALEEAGCVGPILTHLRTAGTHYRGCRVMELLMRLIRCQCQR